MTEISSAIIAALSDAGWHTASDIEHRATLWGRSTIKIELTGMVELGIVEKAIDTFRKGMVTRARYRLQAA